MCPLTYFVYKRASSVILYRGSLQGSPGFLQYSWDFIIRIHVFSYCGWNLVLIILWVTGSRWAVASVPFQLIFFGGWGWFLWKTSLCKIPTFPMFIIVMLIILFLFSFPLKRLRFFTCNLISSIRLFSLLWSGNVIDLWSFRMLI